ncbi:redoxin domain-containing protein [Posidoniimonas polymericola]|nr:redoxin domain-containing protein [Posidoniimonas polymericola]
MTRCIALSVLAAALTAGAANAADTAEPTIRDTPLEVADTAPAPTLPEFGADKPIDLAKVFAEGPTVLVVLRGYPGYQCPLCSRQVGEYIQAAAKLREAGAQVVLVYPGGVSNLAERAEEFLAEKKLPEPLTMVLDPEYALTDAYGLRWDAPNETAYPSTYIIGPDRKATFAVVSKSHGGRVPVAKVLKELQKAE